MAQMEYNFGKLWNENKDQRICENCKWSKVVDQEIVRFEKCQASPPLFELLGVLFKPATWYLLNGNNSNYLSNNWGNLIDKSVTTVQCHILGVESISSLKVSALPICEIIDGLMAFKALSETESISEGRSTIKANQKLLLGKLKLPIIFVCFLWAGCAAP